MVTEHERLAARLAPSPHIKKTDLLAVIGHDLRQPLSAALMATQFAEELLDDGSHIGIAHSQLGIAQRCMRQAIRMADDLLAMGQAEAGTLRLWRAPVDVMSLLEEACALIAPHARAKGVQLHITAGPALPHPLGDHDRLLQVLGNICGNAVKFTPTSGRVALSARENGEVVEVCVTDSGPGISVDELPHVFDAYWHSEGAAAGAGLGLAIAKWIVEAHGGIIEARVVRGGGLTIAFTIPLRPDEPATHRH